MSRPPTPLGTWGKVNVVQVPDGTWTAYARYKDYDGVSRQVERTASSKARARTNLLEALRDRAYRAASGDITSTMRLDKLAAAWLNEVDESSKADRTKQEYHDTWNRYLASRVQNLRVCDVRVSTANRVISNVRDSVGRAAASHVKVVLSGMMSLAVRYDAVDNNPVREIESLGKKPRKRERLINVSTIDAVLASFHASNIAQQWDLVDMMDCLSGLGCRIGELLALDWKTSVGLQVGTLTFHGTVIRLTGKGLHVQNHTKSAAGMRTIKPPQWVMDILTHRSSCAQSPWVFPSTTGTLRDQDNTRYRIRQVVKGTRFEGLHPHDFRHYVAGELDRAGLSAREIADYLGHARISTTQEDYMERGVVGLRAGTAMQAREARVIGNRWVNAGDTGSSNDDGEL